MPRKKGRGDFSPDVHQGSTNVDGVMKVTKEYSMWKGMLERCYSDTFKAKWPTYKDCTCSEEFRVFQKFAQWATTQVGFSPTCHLDKDLLYRSNKLYSTETCVLLPPRVNTLLIHKRFPDRGLPTGVSYLPDRDRYVAQMNKGGKYVMLGRYKSVDEAAAKYVAEKEKEIKSVAEEYKSVLDPRAFDALINYKV